MTAPLPKEPFGCALSKGGEGAQPLHSSFPFPRREGARGWAAMGICCRTGQPLRREQSSVRFADSSFAKGAFWPVRSRAPSEYEACWSSPRPNAPFLKGGGSAQALTGDCRTPRRFGKHQRKNAAPSSPGGGFAVAVKAAISALRVRRAYSGFACARRRRTVS